MLLLQNKKRQVWAKTWGRGTLMHCWLGSKCVQLLWKIGRRFFKKLKVKLPYDPAISEHDVLNGQWIHCGVIELILKPVLQCRSKHVFWMIRIFFFCSSQVSSKFDIVLYLCHIMSKLNLLLLFQLSSGKLLDTKHHSLDLLMVEQTTQCVTDSFQRVAYHGLVTWE